MLTKLSDSLARIAKPWLIVLSFLVMSAMMGYFLPGAQAQLEANGSGPIDLMPFPSPEAVLHAVESLGQAGRAFYLFVETTYDIVYPISYTLFYGLVITVLINQVASQGSRFRRLNLLPLVAFVFDMLENIGIVTLLASYPAQSAAVASYVSVVNGVKWLFAYASILALFGSLAAWGVKKVMRK